MRRRGDEGYSHRRGVIIRLSASVAQRLYAAPSHPVWVLSLETIRLPLSTPALTTDDTTATAMINRHHMPLGLPARVAGLIAVDVAGIIPPEAARAHEHVQLPRDHVEPRVHRLDHNQHQCRYTRFNVVILVTSLIIIVILSPPGLHHRHLHCHQHSSPSTQPPCPTYLHHELREVAPPLPLRIQKLHLHACTCRHSASAGFERTSGSTGILLNKHPTSHNHPPHLEAHAALGVARRARHGIHKLLQPVILRRHHHIIRVERLSRARPRRVAAPPAAATPTRQWFRPGAAPALPFVSSSRESCSAAAAAAAAAGRAASSDRQEPSTYANHQASLPPYRRLPQ
jgi:hypothetical protein